MSDRPVVMSAEQARILEDVAVEMMRREDDRAMKVLALSLAYKFAKPAATEPPSNVATYSPPRNFQFGRHSRKAPCA